MNRTARNLIVWAGVIAVCLALYLFAVRTNLHFISPSMFLVYVAIAAAALTALLWWEIATDSGTDGDNPNRK